ncbi:MAG: YceI family protein [Saprospiraceae bacterium]
MHAALSFLFLSAPLFSIAQPLWVTEKGNIQFKSDAPLELIQAASKEMKGVIDMEERTFAFSVNITSFQGFNSPLQREHFNENYMQSARYPQATFSGRIIEEVDLSKPGEYTVRAKGMLTVHGVSRERIIKSLVVVSASSCKVSSFFTVLLADHDISIPKVVYQKIAEEIEVRVDAVMNLQSR